VDSSRRNVLVTGGSSGVGRATVERFAAAGYQVWFTYLRGRARAEELVDSLRGAPGPVRAFELDQGVWTSHRALYDALPGPVDVLINNAAVGSKTVEYYVDGPEHEQDIAFLRANCAGPLWLCRHVLPGMLARNRGVIVNVCSVGGGITIFPRFHLADGMSKAALAHLSRQLAAEVAYSEVTIIAICPGAVDTAMLRASTLDPMDEAQRRRFEGSLPRMRLITAHEVAELIWQCAQDSATILHGAVVDASMGLGAHPGLISTLPHPTPPHPTGPTPGTWP
jgi:NAD(P)-dependent dehydrogenase (short-subunit alcohol dehydrogenase family)